MNPSQNRRFNQAQTSDNDQSQSNFDPHPNLFPLRQVSVNPRLKQEQLNTVIVSKQMNNQSSSAKTKQRPSKIDNTNKKIDQEE